MNGDNERIPECEPEIDNEETRKVTCGFCGKTLTGYEICDCPESLAERKLTPMMKDIQGVTAQIRVSKITIIRHQENDPDLSDLGEFSDTPGKFAIEHGDGIDTLKYFNPCEPESEDDARFKYNRILKFEDGTLTQHGIIAEAEVQMSFDGGKSWLIQRLQSGGLWGIDSDGMDLADGVYAEEYAQLMIILKAFGLDGGNAPIETKDDNGDKFECYLIRKV